jgi:hypothetical protein
VQALLLQMHRAGVPRDVEMRVVKECVLNLWVPRQIKPTEPTAPLKTAPAPPLLRLRVPHVATGLLYQNQTCLCPTCPHDCP